MIRLPVLDVTAWSSVAILAAHPDDEVLGAGGIVCLLAAAGVRLRLIAVTDGEASHRGCGDVRALACRRARERAAALRELGAAKAEVIRLVPLPRAAADRKAAAINCFGSQLEPRERGVGPVLPAGFVRHFTRDYEVLFPVRSS